MAHLLGKLGKEAIKPILSKNGVWHKPAISAKNLARLRKESLLAGRDWEFDAEPKPEAKPRKLKGHKHDKLKAQRQQDIADKLVGMDAAIEKHRVSRRNIDVPLLDRLLLTPKQQRLKARGV